MTNEKIPGAQVWQAWSSSSFVHETKAPDGARRTRQDASPGFKIQIAGSPEGRCREVRSQPRMNARHKHLFNTGTNCIAPSGLPLLLCLFPGLAPWVFLSRPCGASFAPETNYTELFTLGGTNGQICITVDGLPPPVGTEDLTWVMAGSVPA